MMTSRILTNLPVLVFSASVLFHTALSKSLGGVANFAEGDDVPEDARTRQTAFSQMNVSAEAFRPKGSVSFVADSPTDAKVFHCWENGHFIEIKTLTLLKQNLLKF